MKITILYKLRRALALGAIAGGALVACNKGNTTPAPTRDVELVFDVYNVKNIEIDTIKKYTNMSDVRYIYMIPKNPGWGTLNVNDLHNTRNYLQQRIDINPKKVRGKGTFEFKRGEPSKNIVDSLWYVQNGWAIKSR